MTLFAKCSTNFLPLLSYVSTTNQFRPAENVDVSTK